MGHDDKHRELSQFIGPINNAVHGPINMSYRTNLMKLENFVMVKHNLDSMVSPPESSWFGFFETGSNHDIVGMTETDVYKEDGLGLAQMQRDGKLHFYELNTDHLAFTDEW